MAIVRSRKNWQFAYKHVVCIKPRNDISVCMKNDIVNNSFQRKKCKAKIIIIKYEWSMTELETWNAEIMFCALMLLTIKNEKIDQIIDD